MLVQPLDRLADGERVRELEVEPPRNDPNSNMFLCPKAPKRKKRRHLWSVSKESSAGDGARIQGAWTDHMVWVERHQQANFQELAEVEENLAERGAYQEGFDSRPMQELSAAFSTNYTTTGAAVPSRLPSTPAGPSSYSSTGPG